MSAQATVLHLSRKLSALEAEAHGLPGSARLIDRLAAAQVELAAMLTRNGGKSD